MKFRFFTDMLTAAALLASAVPRQRKTLWSCSHCGRWLGAFDLERGLVATGVFAEEAVYWDDPYFGRVLVAIGIVLKETRVRDRHRIRCEWCGVVNRRRRCG